MRTTKYLIIFIIITLPNIISAGINKSFIRGIGIELGVGHNSLFWSAPFSIKTPGGIAADRNDIYVTPTIHITYKLYLSNKFYLQPFIGYNRFGGKSSGNNYSFDAVELGMFTQYQYSNLSFGVGAKIHHNLCVQYHYSSYDDDHSNWFVKYSGDAGVRISYLIRNISISLESWFGINNLADGPLSGATVYENHYRIMIGYNF